jgi:uncharacterized membrane protein YccC
MLRARIGNWMGDAAQWCRQILLRGQAHAPRNRLAADLVQFEALIEFLRRDDPRHAGAAVSMQRLRERMLLMLPVLSSIADRLGALRAGGRALPPGLEPLVADIAAWLDTPGRSTATEYAALRARILALKPAVDGELDHLLLVTLLLRLEELVDLWQDCTTLQAAIEDGDAPRDTAHYRIRTTRSADARHVDYGMALFSAASAGVALMTYCALWITLGWEGGGNGAMMAAVAAAFFAAQDDPAPSMLSFLLWAIVASVVAGVYLFGVFPAVHDFGSLALVLAVVFLPVGLLLHTPKNALIGLPLMVNLVALLNVQNTYNANIQSFINSSVAMFIGIGFAVVMTRLFRSVGAEWTARRLVRQGWTTLADAAQGRGQQDRQQFAARMLDLLGLLAPRLAATPEGSDIASVDMLTEARIGLNILQLRRARHGLPPTSVEAIEAILDEVAAHYRAQVAQRRPLAAPAGLQAKLEASLRRVQTVDAGKARDEALMGVMGLRFALFPDAPVVDSPAAAQPGLPAPR